METKIENQYTDQEIFDRKLRALAEKLPEGDPVRRYLKDLEGIAPLAQGEEAELVRQMQAGERRARQRLVEAHLLMVVSIAQKYADLVPLLDLIEECNGALIRAAETFTGAEGRRFADYASQYIRQTVARTVALRPRGIRIPVRTVECIQKVNRIAERLQQELGREPCAEEIAEAMGLSLEETEEILG